MHKNKGLKLKIAFNSWKNNFPFQVCSRRVQRPILARLGLQHEGPSLLPASSHAGFSSAVPYRCRPLVNHCETRQSQLGNYVHYKQNSSNFEYSTPWCYVPWVWVLIYIYFDYGFKNLTNVRFSKNYHGIRSWNTKGIINLKLRNYWPIEMLTFLNFQLPRPKFCGTLKMLKFHKYLNNFGCRKQNEINYLKKYSKRCWHWYSYKNNIVNTKKSNFNCNLSLVFLICTKENCDIIILVCINTIFKKWESPNIIYKYLYIFKLPSRHSVLQWGLTNRLVIYLSVMPLRLFVFCYCLNVYDFYRKIYTSLQNTRCPTKPIFNTYITHAQPYKNVYFEVVE